MGIFFSFDLQMYRTNNTIHVNFDFELGTNHNGYHGAARIDFADYHEPREISAPEGYGLIQFRSQFDLPTNVSHDLSIYAIDYNHSFEFNRQYNVVLAGNGFRANGSSAVDILFGSLGNDQMIAFAGDDFLDGGEGNDFLEGGAGADLLIGGNGVDAAVYNSSAAGLTIHLGDPSQNTGDAQGDNYESIEAISASAYHDFLIGDGVGNVLNGRQGSDRMVGGGGNDTYYVDNSLDTVVEVGGYGDDTIYAQISLSLKSGQSIELLSAENAATSTTAIRLAGNSYGNRIVGNAGDNFLNGGKGQDTLTGGAGNDTFMFNSTLISQNVDRITDFNKVSNDTIRLENAVFTTLTKVGWLDASAFISNTTGYALDANDRIIYEKDTGKLIYDSNGSASGGRSLFAWIDPNLTITHHDFYVV